MRHIGIYAYKRSSLRVFSLNKPSVEEEKEKLEQLRAYKLDLKIIVNKAQIPPGPDVDTKDDLILVNSIYKDNNTNE